MSKYTRAGILKQYKWKSCYSLTCPQMLFNYLNQPMNRMQETHQCSSLQQILGVDSEKITMVTEEGRTRNYFVRKLSFFSWSCVTQASHWNQCSIPACFQTVRNSAWCNGKENIMNHDCKQMLNHFD